MCVAAKGRLQGRAATLLLLWAGFSYFFFVYMQQKFHILSCRWLFLRLACNVRRYVLLAPSRGGACFCTRGALQGYPIVAPRSANDIYRPVRDSSGFIFIYSEQRRTHLSTDEQVSFSTRQTATHPLKRSPTAELGCLASRSELVLNILFVAINLSCGA